MPQPPGSRLAPPAGPVPGQRPAASAIAIAVAAVIGRNPLAIHWAALTARAAWEVPAVWPLTSPGTMAAAR